MNPNPLSVRRLIVPVVEAMSASFSLRTSASCSGDVTATQYRTSPPRTGRTDNLVMGPGRRLKHAALLTGIVATIGVVRWLDPPSDQAASAPSAAPEPLGMREFPRLRQ